MKDNAKVPLTTWIICLVIFFFSLYVGGIQNGPFNENPSLIKSIALASLLVSFVVGVLAFFLLLYRLVKRIGKNNQDESNYVAKIPQVLFFGSVIIGAFILVKALSYSYNKTNNAYLKVIPTISLPTDIPTLTLVPTKKTVNKTSETSNVKTNTSKPPLPVLNGGNIFGLVNQYRSSKGLPFFSVSDELCGIAESRANLMMANKMEAFKESSVGNHYGLSSYTSRYSGAGIGENLAANVARDIDVLAIWKNSPPHNELMLWTTKDGTPITKGCIATRVSEVGSIVVLLVGDK